jgi:AcrR family transcriptional regulator
LLKHFRDKDGLLHAVLSDGLNSLNSAIRLAIPRISKPRDQLALIVDMLLTFLDTNLAFSRVLLSEGDRLWETNLRTREFTAIIDGILGQMTQTGELRPDLSVRTVRAALLGALKAMLRERVLQQHARAAVSDDELRLTFSNFLSSCMSSTRHFSVGPVVPPPGEEEPWLNHYLELADMALRASGKIAEA